MDGSVESQRQKARERQRRYASKPEVRARILEQRKQQRARLRSVEAIVDEPVVHIEEDTCSPEC